MTKTEPSTYPQPTQPPAALSKTGVVGMSKPEREVWTLTLAPADDNFPPMVLRMKRVLKWMLRTHGVRCIGYGPNQIRKDDHGNTQT